MIILYQMLCGLVLHSSLTGNSIESVRMVLYSATDKICKKLKFVFAKIAFLGYLGYLCNHFSTYRIKCAFYFQDLFFN